MNKFKNNSNIIKFLEKVKTGGWNSLGDYKQRFDKDWFELETNFFVDVARYEQQYVFWQFIVNGNDNQDRFCLAEELLRKEFLTALNSIVTTKQLEKLKLEYNLTFYTIEKEDIVLLSLSKAISNKNLDSFVNIILNF